MKIILEIDVDNATGNEFQHFPPESKKKFADEVSGMLQNIAIKSRVIKLRQLFEEIRITSGGAEFDPETLYAIIRNEEY
jgi:hypothetical protein